MLSKDARRRPSAQFVRQLNAKAVPAYVPPAAAAGRPRRVRAPFKKELCATYPIYSLNLYKITNNDTEAAAPRVRASY
jgi:hypothetical protein